MQERAQPRIGVQVAEPWFRLDLGEPRIALDLGPLEPIEGEIDAIPRAYTSATWSAPSTSNFAIASGSAASDSTR